MLQNFLQAQLEKTGARQVFFDKDRGAEIFVRACGGTYLALRNGEPTGFAPLKGLAVLWSSHLLSVHTPWRKVPAALLAMKAYPIVYKPFLVGFGIGLVLTVITIISTLFQRQKLHGEARFARVGEVRRGKMLSPAGIVLGKFGGKVIPTLPGAALWCRPGDPPPPRSALVLPIHPPLSARARSRCAHRLRLYSRKEITMETLRCPAGLPGYGYSMQAAAIASALVERENAHIYRMKVREWLDRIEDPDSVVFEDMEEGRVFAEFLTNLVRVGAGLKAVE